MELMTSGAFAQASGLSRKALRLYDELGLLHPARVDPDTLYRFYHPGQLEQARLVAWLRRLGMPLAVIRSVSGLPATASLGPGDIDAETERIGTCRHFSISGPRTGWRPARATATR